jgi:4-amino-4-deoxy-L-arabinose transferase-like glycosyltransferase
LLVAGWVLLVGESSFALRYLSVLSGTIAVALGWRYGNQIHGRSIGFSMALLLATSPYLIWYAQDAKMYSFLLVLSLLSVIIIYRLVENPTTSGYFSYFTVVVVGMYTHVLFALVVPVHFVVWLKHKRNRKALSWLLLFLAIIFAYTLQLKWEIGMWLSDFDPGFPSSPMLKILQTQTYVFAVGYPSSLQSIASFVFLFLFILGLAHSLNRIEVWGHYFLPLLGLYLVSIGMPVYTDRYLITSASGFYAVCALGLKAISEKRLQFIALAFAVGMNLITYFVQTQSIIKPFP